jgi:hypothetical protein
MKHVKILILLSLRIGGSRLRQLPTPEDYSNHMNTRQSHGETNLDQLLAGMKPILHKEIFVFTTFKHNDNLSAFDPIMMFRESEGTTLIITLLEAVREGVHFEFPSRMITLNIHSSLDAVGFLALVTSRLATLNMGVNPVAGFYHDHLFIPADRADDALRALNEWSLQSNYPPICC